LSPTLTITLPNHGLQPERAYSVRMLLHEFLGLDYKISYHKRPEYILQTDGGGQLVIKDSFFAQYNRPEDYLKPENVPGEITYMNETAGQTEQLPVLYGENTLHINKNKIQCGVDLFASAFFMLSRWEEQTMPHRDEHGRFPGNKSLAYKHDFLNRPVVNEYAELLWQLLQKAGFKGERKQRTFTLVPTHDIDDLLFWNATNKKRRYRNLAGDLFKRRNPKLAAKRRKSYADTMADVKNDPYHVYDHLMDKAEKAGVQAQFYFMAGGSTVYDRPYDLNSGLFAEIVAHIKDRGHLIGYHGSYTTWNDPVLFLKEKKTLEQTVDMEITSCRQHYLRFAIPATWQMQEAAGISTDSTLYYSGYPGFRCGSCYAFPVFDILNRKQLQLTEIPLLLMDGDLDELEPPQAEHMIIDIQQQTKKFGGDFVFLRHNGSDAWMYNNHPLIHYEKALYHAE